MDKLLLVFLSLFLFSCASSQREERSAIRQAYEENKLDQALTLLNSKELKENTKNQLLYKLEEGIVLHKKGELENSTKRLEEAKQIFKENYTTKVSQKISSVIINENTQNYASSRFENSLMHYFLTLNHLMESQKAYETKDRKAKKLLFRSRAEVLAWDSTLREFQASNLERAVFKNDLTAKVLGGLIYERTGKRSDKKVALQLYKDGLKLLERNYGLYQSFNQNSQEFQKEYDKLKKIKKAELDEKYLHGTSFFNETKSFLEKKIESLSKRKKNKNFSAVFNLGLIPRKKGKFYNIGFKGALDAVEDPVAKHFMARVGLPVLTLFAANTLGLIPRKGEWTYPGAPLGYHLAQFTAYQAGLEFELPVIEDFSPPQSLELIATDEKGKEYKAPLFLLNPVGEMAKQALAEDALATYLKLAPRIAAKHLIAIMAAYKTYQLLKGKGMMELLAKAAAIAEYLTASQLIKISEKADTRYWSTLPREIRVSELELPPGKYQLRIAGAKEQSLGEVFIEEKRASVKSFTLPRL